MPMLTRIQLVLRETIKGENCPLGIVCRNSNRDDDGQWTWMTDVDVLYRITYEGVAQS